MHWDGAKIDVQVLPWERARFSGVAARADNDVWAVGWSAAGPLAAHFDGHHWLRIALPRVKAARLTDVAAISHDDVWAVGRAPVQSSHGPLPVVMHWNGRRWRLVHLPGSSPPWELLSVDFVSTDDVWVFGVTGPWNHGYGFGPIVLRWNGSRWTPMQTGINSGEFKDWAYGALDVAPTGEVWVAVGEQSGAGGAPPGLVRWSGSTHKVRTSFDMPAWGSGPDVIGIAAGSKNEVWTAGWSPALSYLNAETKSWQRPQLPIHVGSLDAISAISPTDIWAVADRLILRYHC